MIIETQVDSLEVRNNKFLKWYNLIIILLFSATSIAIVTKMITKEFWINFKPIAILSFLILGLLIYGIVYNSKSFYQNKDIKLKIDNLGIWTPKYKLWLWKDIWYFNTIDKRVGKTRSYFLEVRIKENFPNTQNSLLLQLSDFDKPVEIIRTIIEKYASLNGIQDLGHEVFN